MSTKPPKKKRRKSKPLTRRQKKRRAETRRARAIALAIARSAAARRGWETRRRNELSKQQRRSIAAKKAARTRALNKALKQKVVDILKPTPAPKKPSKKKRLPKKRPIEIEEEIEEEIEPVELPPVRLTYFERLGSFYLNLAGFPSEWVVRLVDTMRRAGVRHFRFLRKVPASPKYPNGFASTNWRADIAGMNMGQLEGYVGSMFVPGVDELQQVIVPANQMPPGVLPE